VLFSAIAVVFVSYWMVAQVRHEGLPAEPEGQEITQQNGSVQQVLNNPATSWTNRELTGASDNTTGAPNLTESLAKDISDEIISTVSSPEDLLKAVDSANLSGLDVETLSKTIESNPLSLLDDVPSSQIRVTSDNSFQRIQQYGQDYGVIVVQAVEPIYGPDEKKFRKIIEDATQRGDFSGLNALSANLDDGLKKLLKIEVPPAAISFHKKTIIYLNNFIQILDAIKSADSDPMKAYLAVSDGVDRMIKNAGEIITEFEALQSKYQAFYIPTPADNQRNVAQNGALEALLGFFGGTFSIQQAHAGWPVSELFSIPDMLKWIWDKLQKVWDEMRKVLRDVVVKRLMDKLSDDIVKSLQNSGQPLQVTDWKGYLREAGDITFGAFNEYLKTEGLNLCAPFAYQLRYTFVYRMTQTGFYGLPTSCRFEDFKRNIQFTKDFIERGGWLVYDEMFLPENNYFGMSLIMEDAYNQETTVKKQERTNEARSASGFLNVKECVKSQGRTREDIMAQCDAPGYSGYASAAECKQKFASNMDLACEQWNTLTPGDAVAKAVGASVQGDHWWMTNVQSVISALVNVFISKIFDTAKGGLLGSTGSTGREYADEAINDLNQQDNQKKLDEMRQNYDDYIDYVQNTLLPVVDQDLTLAQNSVASCPTSPITYKDDQDNDVTVTVQELGDLLTSAKEALEMSVGDAQANLSELDGVDLTKSQEVLTVTEHYGTFVSNYESIFSDMQLYNKGHDAALLKTFINIRKALSSFSC